MSGKARWTRRPYLPARSWGELLERGHTLHIVERSRRLCTRTTGRFVGRDGPVVVSPRSPATPRWRQRLSRIERLVGLEYTQEECRLCPLIILLWSEIVPFR